MALPANKRRRTNSGEYSPLAGWISNYSPDQRALIHALKLREDEAFLGVEGNPLVFWAEGSRESAGSMAQWSDYGGWGNHATQGVGAKQPTSGNTTQNGKNVIDWDGGDSLELPAGLYSIPNGPYTMFIVSKRDTETAAVETLWLALTGAIGSAIFAYNATAGAIVFRNGVVSSASKGGGTSTNFQVLRARRSGTTHALTFNGNTEVTNTTAVDVATIDSMLLGYSPSNPLTGSIAEVIICNRSLSTSEIALIKAYLFAKWGLP